MPKSNLQDVILRISVLQPYMTHSISLKQRRYENQDWSAGEAERVKEYNEHEKHASFAELIACMRDKEDYFTSKKSGGYENFWETMEFTLRDITGDGQEELILGKKGVIYAVWTIRDGVTACLDGTYPEGYLCEGNVIEHYAFLDGQHFHHYRKPTNDGYCTKLLDVEYHRTEGTWILNESQDGSGWEEISEEKAMEIIGRYPRGLVDPQHAWTKARKAYCISSAPVPQTDTGR